VVAGEGEVIGVGEVIGIGDGLGLVAIGSAVSVPTAAADTIEAGVIDPSSPPQPAHRTQHAMHAENRIIITLSPQVENGAITVARC